jgi:hypothetical protein
VHKSRAGQRPGQKRRTKLPGRSVGQGLAMGRGRRRPGGASRRRWAALDPESAILFYLLLRGFSKPPTDGFFRTGLSKPVLSKTKMC